jgi:hypothetical protein
MSAQDGISLDNSINRQLDAGTITSSQAQGYIDQLTPYLQYTNLASGFQATISRLQKLQNGPVSPLPILGTEGTVVSKNAGDTVTPGSPTTPNLARGNLKNTTIDQMNNSLAHACDFAQDIKKSIGLKKFIKSIAQSIRKAIRAIKRFLGLSDNSGLISTIIQKLSAIAKEVRNFIKEYIVPVQNFLKDVVGFIQWAIATIQWILSLPAKFIQLLADCLKKVMSAIASVFQDALADAAAADQAEANAELLAAGGTPPLPQPGISVQLVAQAKDTLKAGQEAVTAVTSTVGQAVSVATTTVAAVSATAAAVSGASTLSPGATALVTPPTSLTDTTNATQSVSAIQAANATPAQTQASASSATTPANPKNTV